MRRVMRIFFWMVKGVLLLIALGALVMWPVSRGRWMRLSAERYAIRPERAEWRLYHIGAYDGRLTAGRFIGLYNGNSVPALVRQQAEAAGQGWKWTWKSQRDQWNDEVWRSKWGPLRWEIYDPGKPPPSNTVYRFATPLWFVALAIGAWPLSSISFALRRSMKRRRSARVGVCTRCGYDLRATPEKTGELLAVCPECGEATLPRKPSAALR